MLEFLANEGLPSSRPTYFKYEHLGVFKPGRQSALCGLKLVRLFTKEEMMENVERYKEWSRSKVEALHA